MLPLLLLACGPDAADSGGAGGVAAPLTVATAWVLDLDHEDPLADHRPQDARCESAAVSEEYGGVEIDTGDCSYAQLVQPLGADLAVGDPVQVAAWHQDLVPETAEDAGADAHIAVLIDGVVLWEAWTTVPSAPESWDDTVPAPANAAAGSPVILHLHNHGANAWNVERVDRPE